jgi:hypothetical protein
MRENLRKPVLFIAIVAIGSILVLFDTPLVILLPLILITGFGVLLAVGSITVAEIKDSFLNLKKTGILKRLDEMKFLEKGAADTKKTPPPVPVKKEAKKGGEAKPGFFAHISTFFSSVGSLGSVLRQRSSRGKKVEEINKLLDKTVTEKVSAPPPAIPAPVAPAGGGVGAGSGKTPDLENPFMSLSGDEFDEGLLEGLGDDDLMKAPSPAPAVPAPDTGGRAGAAGSGPDLPAPTLDISAAAGDILKDAGSSFDEPGGPGKEDLSDADFGDLDNLSLDNIDLDAELGESSDTTPAPEAPAPEPAAPPVPAAAPPADSDAIKTAWVPSDAPKGTGEVEDNISTQADMAAFASGTGGDEDLLSSIASDVKYTKKEQDLSLLRELKDFRAPAAEIEKELGGMYERMNLAEKTRKKNPPATDGIK